MRPLSTAQRADLERATAAYAAQRDGVSAYLESRGITEATAVRFRLGYTSPASPGHPEGRLSIPSLAAGDQPVHMSFRAIDEHQPKYLHLPGESRLFNSRAVVEAEDEIHVTEGQLDAVILEQCGLHAVGVLGAKAWKKHFPRVFAGFTRVYVWADSDKAGAEFANTVCDGLSQSVRVRLGPDVKDVNAAYLKGGQDAIMEALNA